MTSAEAASAELHAWAIGEGLRGAGVDALLDGLCRRLLASGVPLWRAFAGGRTLHPRWGGHSFTWQRDLGISAPALFERGLNYEVRVQSSPFATLISRLEGVEGSDVWPSLRRRLSGPDRCLDFPVLEELAAAGGTDYFAQVVSFGVGGDPARGTGVGYSFTTDRPGGFAERDLAMIAAALPVLSLAAMAHVEHAIAVGLLAAYLGADAGGRVHAGAIERGSVLELRAVLWFADIRGFTAFADAQPGLAVIDLLNDTFEVLAAPLRKRGGEILKFLGDGMLVQFACRADEAGETCRHALEAAEEAMAGIDRLNARRRAAGKPVVTVDLALHLGEVLYGNVGAIDRLDFTVIGPAVNEVVRIEALCDRLGRNFLVSAEFAATLGVCPRLVPLGRHALRGVREPQDIYGIDFSI